MKKDINNKSRIYLKTLIQLREIIKLEYPDGGKLPAERVMCERLDVSRVTYRKVLGWLASENVISSSSRRGHWVLEEYRRCAKLGIIIGNGTESPFISDGHFLARILDELASNQYFGHLIQASSLENIQFSALSHAVRGLIWIHPPTEAFEHIRLIQASGLPVVVISHRLEETDAALKDINYVEMDFAKSVGDGAEVLIKHGYRRAVYLSACNDQINQEFSSAFQKANIPFDAEQIITGLEDIKPCLKALMKYDIDVIFSDGGWERMESLLKFCAKLPAKKRPDLIFPKKNNLKKLAEKYQELNIDIAGYQQFKDYHLGKKGTKMLVQYLKTGKKMSSQLYSAYDVILKK